MNNTKDLDNPFVKNGADGMDECQKLLIHLTAWHSCCGDAYDPNQGLGGCKKMCTDYDDCMDALKKIIEAINEKYGVAV